MVIYKARILAGILAVGGVVSGLWLASEMALAQRLQPSMARIPARSGLIDFLLTPRGLGILRASHVPMAKALLKLAGEPEADTPWTPEADAPAEERTATSTAAPAASSGCGTVTGTRFNLEP